jgi:glycosyltransferase involved in cell wall biosynthesis
VISLSIITPVFNNAGYMQSCIDNVIEQNCPNCEHIVIDGGSTDGTLEIIRRNAEKYSHIRWVSEKDRGQSDAMNKGIRMAEGSVISFLNVDDFYEPGVFNRILPLFRELPEPSLLIGNCNIWDDDGGLRRVSKPHHLSIMDLLMLRGEFPQNPTSYFYHKELHNLTGLYNVGEHFNMDVEFIYDAVRYANLVYVDEVWGNFRMLRGSKTKDLNDSGHYWANYFTFREKYVRKLPASLRVEFYLKRHVERTDKWFKKKYRSFEYYRRKLASASGD